MLGNSPAVLAVASVVSLSLISLLCLRCKKKSKTIHEAQPIYNPQIFQRGGSRFEVTQSKTVTRTNEITGETLNPFVTEESDEQSDYQNITEAHTGTRTDHTYVAPLPVAVYVNEEEASVRQTQDVYVNVLQDPKSDDEDDYENSQFLKDQEEPDYVNENGEGT